LEKKAHSRIDLPPRRIAFPQWDLFPFGPKADSYSAAINALFDQLVSEYKQTRRYAAKVK